MCFCSWCSFNLVLSIFYDFLHDVNEVVLLPWCQYDLSNALWVWPILDFDHGALLYLGLEEELLFLAIDVETDFSSSNIDLYPHSAQEWTSKDKQGFLGNVHVKHDEVDRDEAILNLDRTIRDEVVDGFGHVVRHLDKLGVSRANGLGVRWLWGHV